MPTSTVIKNGNVLLGKEIKKLDILVKNGHIAALGQGLEAKHVVDASGLLVTPGLIDVHVHLREPGQTKKEDIASGTKAGAHGGYTTVCAMANVDPVPDTPALMTDICRRNLAAGKIRVLQYGPVTKRLTTDALTDFTALKQSGAFALSNDGHGIQSAQTMQRALKKAAEAHMILAAHLQDDSLFAGGVINEGPKAREFGVRGIPEVSESSQAARDLILTQQTGAHYHVCHVSVKETVELIRWAKAQGINVTCEVTPHHLLLNDGDIHEADSNYKMNPPLRTVSDQQALLQGLLDNTIDMIATDHAPHTKADKGGGLTQAAFGITGLETAFSLLYTNLVKTRQVGLEQLVSKMTTAPAKAFNLGDCGTLLPGNRADIALFDLARRKTLDPKDYFSKGVNSPFNGQKVWGETMLTMVEGKIVYKDSPTLQGRA